MRNNRWQQVDPDSMHVQQDEDESLIFGGPDGRTLVAAFMDTQAAVDYVAQLREKRQAVWGLRPVNRVLRGLH